MSGCRSRRASCKTSAKRTGKSTCIYGNRRRLESCSRDPIGYDGSPWNLYEFLASHPVFGADPTGEDWLDCMADCVADNDPLNLALEAAIAQLSVGLWPKEVFAKIATAMGKPRLAHAIRVSANSFNKITNMPKGFIILINNGRKPNKLFSAITGSIGRVAGPLLIAHGLAQAATQVHCAGFCTAACVCGDCTYSDKEGNILTALKRQYF